MGVKPTDRIVRHAVYPERANLFRLKEEESVPRLLAASGMVHFVLRFSSISALAPASLAIGILYGDADT